MLYLLESLSPFGLIMLKLIGILLFYDVVDLNSDKCNKSLSILLDKIDFC